MEQQTLIDDTSRLATIADYRITRLETRMALIDAELQKSEIERAELVSQLADTQSRLDALKDIEPMIAKNSYKCMIREHVRNFRLLVNELNIANDDEYNNSLLKDTMNGMLSTSSCM